MLIYSDYEHSILYFITYQAYTAYSKEELNKNRIYSGKI